MKRYAEIDILKGIAVICMVVFHLFYYPNKYGYKEIKHTTFPLPLIAKIAQFIFIGCVGINLVFMYSKKEKETDEEYYTKQIKRILKLSLCALLMTLFTYFVFGDGFIKFGILHFIALSSLLLLPIIGKPRIIQGMMIIVSVLYLLNKTNPQLFQAIPDHLAFVSGFHSKWSAIDHFPLMPWLLIMGSGVLLGHEYIDKKPDFLSKDVEEFPLVKGLQYIGSKSLEIYMIQWVILYLIYSHIYPNFIRNVPY